MDIEPVYQHDCSHCEFLGTATLKVENPSQSGTYDLYACEKETYTELIARYKSNGPDYFCATFHHKDSYAEQLPHDPALALAWALNRVRRLGL